MNFDNVSRNQLCPCGSANKFKFCHGSLTKDNINPDNIFSENGYYINSLMTDVNKHICDDLPDGKSLTDEEIPPGMLIIEDCISDELCRQLLSHTEDVKHTKAKILNSKNKPSQNTKTMVEESQRKTEIFDLGEFNESLKSQLSILFKGIIKEYYNRVITSFEQPHILRYSPGGFYHLHSDSEVWLKSQKKWKRVNHRSLSFVIYLNNEFTGGKLVFPNFRFHIKPRKGLLVCFPSDHRFMHEVMATTSGERFAIVTWAAVANAQGVEELEPINLENVIEI